MREELAAFDKIQSVTNQITRRLLFSQYSLERKEKITQHLRSEIEKLEKLNKQKINNIKKLNENIKCMQSDISSLHETTRELKNSNIDLKIQVMNLNERKQKILKKNQDMQEHYANKWRRYKAVYESTPYYKKLLAYKTEIKMKIFLIEQRKQEQANLTEALNMWHDINTKIDRAIIIKLAKFMAVERPEQLKMIQTTLANIAEINNQIAKSSTKKCVETGVEKKTFSSIFKSDHGEYDLPDLKTFFINYGDIKLPETNFKRVNVSEEEDYTYKIIPTPTYIKEFKSYSAHYVVCTLLTHVLIKEYTEIDDYTNETKEKDVIMNIEKSKKKIKILEDNVMKATEAKSIFKRTKMRDLHIVKKIGSMLDNEVAHHGEQEVIGQILNVEPKDIHTKVEKLQQEVLQKAEMTQTMSPAQSVDEQQNAYGEASSPIFTPPTQYQDNTASFGEINESADHAFESMSFNTFQYEMPEAHDTVGPEEIKLSRKRLRNSSLVGPEDQNLSGVSDACNNYNETKDQLLKKYKLDSSPTYVYTKNSLAKSAEKNTTSKFFTTTEATENQVEARGASEIESIVASTTRDKSHQHTQSPDNAKKVVADYRNYNESVLFQSGTLGCLSNPSSDSELDETAYDFTSMLESPAELLSRKSDGPTEFSQKDEPNTSKTLLGMGRPSFSLFGNSATDEPRPGTTTNDQNNESVFAFNFQKKKSVFFKLFK